MAGVVGRHVGGEGEATPWNWARIDCANPNNQVTYEKLQKMAGIFATH